jgi:hypothetical protein
MRCWMYVVPGFAVVPCTLSVHTLVFTRLRCLASHPPSVPVRVPRRACVLACRAIPYRELTWNDHGTIGARREQTEQGITTLCRATLQRVQGVWGRDRAHARPADPISAHTASRQLPNGGTPHSYRHSFTVVTLGIDNPDVCAILPHLRRLLAVPSPREQVLS